MGHPPHSASYSISKNGMTMLSQPVQVVCQSLSVVQETQIMDKVIRIHTLVHIIERTVAHEAQLHVAGGTEDTAVRRCHRCDRACTAACMMTDHSDIAGLLEDTGNEVAAGAAPPIFWLRSSTTFLTGLPSRRI